MRPVTPEEPATQMLSVQIDRWGDASELHLVHDLPIPEPGPGQILLRNHAAGLNPVDHKVRRGTYTAAYGEEFPIVLGRDFAARVEALGPDAPGGWSVGDEVVGTLHTQPKLGTYASHILVSDAVMARRPEAVAIDQAAALPVPGLTAWQALHEVAKVTEGQRVLVHAGAGGVGHIAVQLAKRAGCEVIATCSPHNTDFVRGLGADRAVDYTGAPFEEQITGCDVVIDGVGGDVLTRSYSVLKPGGIAVTMPDRPDKSIAEAAGVRVELVFVRPDAEQLADLLDLVARGELSVHIDATYAMNEAAGAHEVLEGGHVRGKLVMLTGKLPLLSAATA